MAPIIPPDIALPPLVPGSSLGDAEIVAALEPGYDLRDPLPQLLSHDRARVEALRQVVRYVMRRLPLIERAVEDVAEYGAGQQTPGVTPQQLQAVVGELLTGIRGKADAGALAPLAGALRVLDEAVQQLRAAVEAPRPPSGVDREVLDAALADALADVVRSADITNVVRAEGLATSLASYTTTDVLAVAAEAQQVATTAAITTAVQPVADQAEAIARSVGSLVLHSTRAPVFGSPVTSRAAGRTLTNGSSVETATTRVRHVVTETCLGVHLVVTGWANAEQPQAQAGTVKAALQIGGSAVIHPVHFGGERTKVVQPGVMVRSDPLGLVLAKGDVLWVRISRTIPTGGNWTANVALRSAEGEGSVDSDAVDTGTITVTTSDAQPAWTALSVVSAAPSVGRSVAIFGDSISNGVGESVPEDGGYMIRAMPSGVGVLRLNNGGATAREYVDNGTSATSGRRRLPLAASCRYAWVEFGVNDLNTGSSIDQVKSNLLKLWRTLAAAGMTIYQSTLTPWASTTDGFTTVAGQSPYSRHTERLAINDWIRTTPAPLTGYLEVADAVESSRNSGVWAVGAAPLTADGVHPSTEGHQRIAAAITAATVAAFS